MFAFRNSNPAENVGFQIDIECWLMVIRLILKQNKEKCDQYNDNPERNAQYKIFFLWNSFHSLKKIEICIKFSKYRPYFEKLSQIEQTCLHQILFLCSSACLHLFEWRCQQMINDLRYLLNNLILKKKY